jgi:hypothetical protein
MSHTRSWIFVCALLGFAPFVHANEEPTYNGQIFTPGPPSP